jgi:hypothetical protein
MIKVDYDKAARSAVLSFENGRKLKLSNVTEEHAKQFAERHGEEFARRDCILHTGGAIETRGDGNG